MMTEIMKNYAKELCEKPENILTPHFFTEHLLIVAEYGDKLSAILNGKTEIVTIAAYLHDISAVIDFKTLPTHNEKSADIAENILQQHNYDKSTIGQIKKCILNHITPLGINDGSVEDICLSNADAISQIVNPSFWLYFAFKILSLDFNDARKWYLNKIESSWNLLIEPAKKLIEEKYVLVKRIV